MEVIDAGGKSQINEGVDGVKDEETLYLVVVC